jgi:zinc-ribbon family
LTAPGGGFGILLSKLNPTVRPKEVAMIIWGSRGITSSLAKGFFHCPRCDQQRSYDHKKVRRFFTLFFIPLIPLESLGEYVECQFCKGT